MGDIVHDWQLPDGEHFPKALGYTHILIVSSSSLSPLSCMMGAETRVRGSGYS